MRLDYGQENPRKQLGNEDYSQELMHNVKNWNSQDQRKLDTLAENKIPCTKKLSNLCI